MNECLNVTEDFESALFQSQRIAIKRAREAAAEVA